MGNPLTYLVAVPTIGGGGVFNLGRLVLNDCVISSNRTHNGPNGVPTTSGGISPGEFGGFGAGILNVGMLMLTNCRIAGNQTGNGGNGADGVWTASTTCALAGWGGDGGYGAAIYNSDGWVMMNTCVLSGNSTGTGGNAGLHGGPVCGGSLGP